MIMAFHHRKFLISETKKPHFSKKFNSDSCYLCYVCPENCYLSPPPPPPLQPSPRPELSVSTKNHIPIVLILMLCVLGVAFFILSYLTISRYRNSRRNVSPAPETLTANFADENRGPSLDHPIWFIRTVGLPQSVIDSIESFAYRKGEGLIDGNDCSVCLNDIRQNEMIRLLPKCTHAFHLDCIDTWLRSHKTCPVCRAPVVAVDRDQDVRVTSIESSPSSSNYLENRSEIEGNDEPIIIQVDVAIDDESRMQKLRVMSDVANRTRGIGSFDGDLQPVRRSVSMDLSHDSINYDVDQEECSDHTSLKIISRRVKRSSSFSGKRKSEKDRS